MFIMTDRSVQVSLRLLYAATSLISLYRLRKAQHASQPASIIVSEASESGSAVNEQWVEALRETYVLICF